MNKRWCLLHLPPKKQYKRLGIVPFLLWYLPPRLHAVFVQYFRFVCFYNSSFRNYTANIWVYPFLQFSFLTILSCISDPFLASSSIFMNYSFGSILNDDLLTVYSLFMSEFSLFCPFSWKNSLAELVCNYSLKLIFSWNCGDTYCSSVFWLPWLQLINQSLIVPL